MTVEGVDFANERPSGAALMAAGKRFVVRYLSPNTQANPGKRVTAAEISHYRAAGLDLAFVWETTTSRAEAGRAAGVADAQAAVAVRKSLGIPQIAIYFAVDEDTTGAKVAAYFQGVISVLGLAFTGVYAGYNPVTYLFDHSLVRYGWQTYAWSGGRWNDRAQLQQYHNGVKVAGETVDLCRAMKDDFGQWAAPGKQSTTEADMELTDKITNVQRPDVHYSAPSTTVAGNLASTNYYVLQTRNQMNAQFATVIDLLGTSAKVEAAIAAALATLPTGVSVDAATLQTALVGALKEFAIADDTPAAPLAMTAHAQTLLSILALFLSVCGTMGLVVRWLVRRYLSPLSHVAEIAPDLGEMVKTWNGDPGRPHEGIPPRPSFPARMFVVESNVSEIRSQVTNNGGSSMKDKVDKTFAAVTSGNTAQAEHAASQAVST